jgi:hypothetical protein
LPGYFFKRHLNLRVDQPVNFRFILLDDIVKKKI